MALLLGQGPEGPPPGPQGQPLQSRLRGNHGDLIMENLWNDLPRSWFLYEDMCFFFWINNGGSRMVLPSRIGNEGVGFEAANIRVSPAKMGIELTQCTNIFGAKRWVSDTKTILKTSILGSAHGSTIPMDLNSCAPKCVGPNVKNAGWKKDQLTVDIDRYSWLIQHKT